jgi:hypothetical protein
MKKAKKPSAIKTKELRNFSALFHRIVSLICHSAGDIFVFLGKSLSPLVEPQAALLKKTPCYAKEDEIVKMLLGVTRVKKYTTAKNTLKLFAN